MSSNLQAMAQKPGNMWRMPVAPEDYDRSPLTSAERWALELSAVYGFGCHSKESIAAKNMLARFETPIADVFRLRHRGRCSALLSEVQILLRREMHRRQKMFWDWSPSEWIDLLCPTPALFWERYQRRQVKCVRVALMDVAYLLGEVTDLRPVGMALNVSMSANAYFGTDLMAQQCNMVLANLAGKGYRDQGSSATQIRRCLSTLFILNRSPYLEALSAELLDEVTQGSGSLFPVYRRIALALEELDLLPARPRNVSTLPKSFDSSGMAHEWYEFCMTWYEHAVDLSPNQRVAYTRRILTVGRWLHQHFPQVRTPEQWTEDLALRFQSDLCSWVGGQYAGDKGKELLKAKGKAGAPLQALGITSYLSTLRRYFTDLSKRPHAVGNAKAGRIKLDFTPSEAFATPKQIRRTVDRAAPRDIDLRVWARLTIAAATLSPNDLPQGAQYPLSFYRALGLVWVTAARRPNEIERLRLDCVREDWDPEMLDEDNHPVERIAASASKSHETQEGAGEKVPRIYYLHIPAGKTKGPFWIWIPDYVAEAINAWKGERPRNQQKMLDRKDQEYVDYLFCFKDSQVGSPFINQSLIPTLCAKAGVDVGDAKGRITGHRGRSTRLTLLRNNGVGLDDLAEYAGHADTRTIRRYAAQNPIHLHRIIKGADDLSRVIGGVVDVQVAAKGLPALRWFIGYDADGQPMYCANQVYHTCPHRLDCVKCGMFIGGEKARLLHEGENTLPIESKVPMTPIEKCVVDGDQAGAEACRVALQQIPAPETPDLHLIFNPEGLSNHELEKLAELGTIEALNKLKQALEVHEQRLEEAQQHKTGRNALVGARKKRIHFIKGLLANAERFQNERTGG